MPKILTRFSTYTLLVALAISAVAEFYSIIGLTTIFSAAVLPVVIMGVVLGLGKIIATVWLKINWERASLTYKIYLIPAVIVLMFLTSMGIFGFLSAAHSDQSLISGDVQSRVAVYDEKIKTAKENIDANRKALKQMDEAVDAVLSRSSSETGAARAVEIRRSQQRERTRLQSEIAAEQKIIAAVSEERAPIAAEVRKVEAEVGPLKFIAALIYGNNPDANLLESAVRWVIILIVVVFDPLALVLLLAAQQSYRWERQREADESEAKSAEIFESFLQKSRLVDRELELERENEQTRIAAANLAAASVERIIPEVDIPKPERDIADIVNEEIAKIESPPVEWEVVKEEPKYDADDGALSDDQIRQIEYTSQKFNLPSTTSDSTQYSIIECYRCGTQLLNAPGIGPFCPNKACDVADGPFLDEKEPVEIQINWPPKESIESKLIAASSEVTVDSDITVQSQLSESHIETENITQEKILYHYNDGHIVFEGKKMSIDNLKSIRPDLVLPLDGVVPNKIDFGREFPSISINGDTYIRIDNIPHRVYKFNGSKWMNVDKIANTTYLTNQNYLRYLIEKLELNEYDPEFLTLSEQDEIEIYLTTKKS